MALQLQQEDPRALLAPTHNLQAQHNHPHPTHRLNPHNSPRPTHQQQVHHQA